MTSRNYLTRLIDARAKVTDALSDVEAGPWTVQEDVQLAHDTLVQAKALLLNAILYIDMLVNRDAQR